MDKLNDIEEEFLNILGIEPIESEGEVSFRTKDDIYEPNKNIKSKESFVFKGKDSVLHFYLEKNIMRRIVLDVRSEEYTIEEKLLDNGFASIGINLSTYYIDEKTKSRYNKNVYSIEIVPTFNREDLNQFITYIRSNKKVLEPCYINCGLSSIQGFETGSLNDDNGPYELNSDNYERILKKLIGIMYKHENKVEDFFLKMMPLFGLIYNQYEKISEMYPDDYLNILKREKDRINELADKKIASINDKRLIDLENNYKQQVKLLSFIEEKQKRK